MPNLTRALTEYRQGQVSAEVDVCMYVYMGVLRSRKLCAGVFGVGVGLLKRENPAACKAFKISYSRQNGDVSECKRRQWSKNERRPQRQGPAML